MAGQERVFDKYPAVNPFNPSFRIIAGGAPEVTTVYRFAVQNVGGQIKGQREVSGEMVGGWMEGGRTVEVTGVLTDKDFLKLREMIAKECNTSKNTVTIDMVTEDARFIEDLNADSMAAVALGLYVQDEFLHGNLFPPQLAMVIGTPRHFREALDILLLEESPMPDVPLEQARLQLINADMFQRLAVARERYPDLDDSSIKEITFLGKA